MCVLELLEALLSLIHAFPSIKMFQWQLVLHSNQLLLGLLSPFKREICAASRGFDIFPLLLSCPFLSVKAFVIPIHHKTPSFSEEDLSELFQLQLPRCAGVQLCDGRGGDSLCEAPLRRRITQR